LEELKKSSITKKLFIRERRDHVKNIKEEKQNNNTNKPQT